MSGLTGDVNITSPTDLQPLRYDAASSKWINSVTLGDIVIYNSADGANAADFLAYTLTNKTGTAFDWSVAPKFGEPIIDASDVVTMDPSSRKLYKTDGTTALFDWSGSAPKFPTLTNSASNAFLTTDASGNMSVASVPNAGIIPPTYAILAGDGAGNAQASYFDFAFGSAITTWTLTGDFQTAVGVQNAGTGVTSRASVFIRSDAGNQGEFNLWGTGSNPPSGTAAGDLEISHPSAAAGSAILINSDGSGAGHPIRFRTYGGEVGRFGDNGFMVGTTTDPGAGVINVSSGYRIGNAAAINQSLVGNGTSFVSGSIPGKASVTSTVDQTATTETAHVVYTVPANSVAVGTTFRIHAFGNVDNGTTLITFTPRIRWGGTGGTSLLATPVFSASTTPNTNRAYVLDATVTIRTTGATGTAVAEMHYIERSNDGTIAAAEKTHADNSGTTAVTIDTTANKDLDLTWALSATTGTPHMRTIGGTIEVVKP